jgi:hypothetical protein
MEKQFSRVHALLQISPLDGQGICTWRKKWPSTDRHRGTHAADELGSPVTVCDEQTNAVGTWGSTTRLHKNSNSSACDVLVLLSIADLSPSFGCDANCIFLVSKILAFNLSYYEWAHTGCLRLSSWGRGGGASYLPGGSPFRCLGIYSGQPASGQRRPETGT